MFRKMFFISIVLVILFTSITPAGAISYGEFDGEDHPNVGSMVVFMNDEMYQWCSGTLIDKNVFLTASHCTAPLDDYLADGVSFEMKVTFDPTISEEGTFYTGMWHTNPVYNSAYGYDDPGDVAVILLDEEPENIIPARLPEAGLLDELKKDGVLKDTLFTAVGYGMVRYTNHQGSQALLDNLDRNRVDQSFLNLTNAWITLSMNLATDNGGTCYGDSGGPHFIHLDGVETDIVAAITVTGDMYCKATDKDYRMDTPAARAYLSEYVTLP